MTLFYIWFHLIVAIMALNNYSSNYDYHQELLKSISIYLILHSKMSHFYIKETVDQHKESYQMMGLNNTIYWIGNFIFDFCNLLLPLIISVIIILVL